LIIKNNIGMPLFCSIWYKVIQHNVWHFHFDITLTQSGPHNFTFAISLENATVQNCNSPYCFIVWELSFILIVRIFLINNFRISDARWVSVIFLIVVKWKPFAIEISAIDCHLFFVLAVLISSTFHSFSHFNSLVAL